MKEKKWWVDSWNSKKGILTTSNGLKNQDFKYRGTEHGVHLIDVCKHFGDHEYDCVDTLNIPAIYPVDGAVFLAPSIFYSNSGTIMKTPEL